MSGEGEESGDRVTGAWYFFAAKPGVFLIQVENCSEDIATRVLMQLELKPRRQPRVEVVLLT